MKARLVDPEKKPDVCITMTDKEAAIIGEWAVTTSDPKSQYYYGSGAVSLLQAFAKAIIEVRGGDK